ncbi:RNA polymerase sigma factor [Emticicia sp. TH156]|uniref:RNA polymerase sigma factor n=1 Tax=Emticicia sp. TH156 TaxID=2067454 RepID=UPI000C784B16|nr:sigma-70 family RNA polymerase sigma factor [Emticicia sp. TH156]PLK42433.1 hypothetical protein C0V77_20680 [Emticicia sp. TH156]
MPLKFTDQEIIEGLLSREARIGNLIAEQLYKQNNKAITHMVLKNNGVIEDAEDIFQEVLILFINHVWNGSFTLRNDVRISTYLYSIAFKLWLKKLRKSGKAAIREAEFAAHFLLPETSPEGGLIELEELEKAYNVFAKLGELCQAILKSYYLDRKSIEEIANLFNLGNVNAVKVRKFRCIKNLNKLMNI